MKNNFFKIVRVSLIIVVIAALALVFLVASRPSKDYSDKYAGFNLSGASSGRTNIYSRYRERYENVPAGRSDIDIDIFSWTSAEGVSVLENFQNTARVLRTEESSFIEYSVFAETPGLYNIQIEYFPLEARGIPIERSFYINGEIPFLGAERLTFWRVWGDEGEIRLDNQGNEIRPAQVEKPRWEKAWFTDSLGYITDPYSFYLHEGENIIKIVGVNEPVAIRSLSLKAPAEVLSYRNYLASANLSQYNKTPSGYLQKIQGEDAVRRSDPSLYAIYDRSSGATEPASVAKIKLNMIGGEQWGLTGQWIEWDIEVPESGMYRITIKGRQNYDRGFVSNRSVFVNGEILCNELAAVPFTYSNKWNLVTLKDDQGDILVPLEKGLNTLRLQATLGGMGEMLSVMEESVYRLNAIYRKILILTGPEPDRYRDYRVNVVYPELMGAMEHESRILYKLVDDLTRYSGERSSQAASALTLANQLSVFVRRPDRIPKALASFKINISTLADSLLALAESQLDIDYIVISSQDAKIPPVRENFFTAASHEIRSFLASFFVDYNNLGDVHKGADVIEVWMLAGRDQSTILKTMIDDTFIPSTGIRVNVKLVAPDAVMPAVVAGTGPDVVLTIPQGDVINYAMRKAVLDISKLPGYNDVIKEFSPSVLTPFGYNGGVWGLPETLYFHVMYYRRDILEELNIDLPDTWDDVISILPIIQRNNMNIGIPSVMNTLMPADFSNFLAQLFQRGGRLYNVQGSRTLLDNEIAIEAFDAYTKFFTHYKTPTLYNFVNRFRTGEMPIAFDDYTWFNTLEVFAPELRGLWSFARMPGYVRSDGTVDRSVSTGTLACMIISSTEYPDQSWEFLKWWISANTQLRFGRELESLIGAAARYPTANNEAFRRLSWGSQQMAVLDEQREWLVGIPEVPGGYFFNRHITNAVRKVINEKAGTRETLLDYTITINDEMLKKRKEFGLE